MVQRFFSANPEFSLSSRSGLVEHLKVIECQTLIAKFVECLSSVFELIDDSLALFKTFLLFLKSLFLLGLSFSFFLHIL